MHLSVTCARKLVHVQYTSEGENDQMTAGNYYSVSSYDATGKNHNVEVLKLTAL